MFNKPKRPPLSHHHLTDRQLLVLILETQDMILRNQETIMDNLNSLTTVLATIATQVTTIAGQGGISPAAQAKIDAALSTANGISTQLGTLITPAA